MLEYKTTDVKYLKKEREKDVYRDSIIVCNYVHSMRMREPLTTVRGTQNNEKRYEIMNYYNWTPITPVFFVISSSSLEKEKRKKLKTGEFQGKGKNQF